MKTSLRQFLFLIAFVFASIGARAEMIPLRLVVDGVELGDLNANLNKDGSIESLKSSELINYLNEFILPDKIIRITNFTNAKDQSISKVDLEKVGILVGYEEKELKIILNIPLEIRTIKDFPIYAQKIKSGIPMYDKNYSGYLNLFGLYGYSTNTTPTLYSSGKDPFSGQLELVQNLNFFTLETTANYLEFDEKPLQRRDTSLVHDFTDSQVRLRLGDFNAVTQGFQGTVTGNGIQLYKQFNIYPNQKALNRRSTVVQVKNNSLLEVYINSNLIVRTRVYPGPYNLKDLPLVYGQNKVRVVLLDDFGGREEFVVDLMYDDQIFAKGVNEFAYQAGKPSYFDINEKKYLEDNFSSLFHKYGLTDETSISLSHQNYKNSNLYGLGVGFLTGMGTYFVDFGHYSDENISGSHASRWRYNSPEWSLQGFEKFRILASADYRSKNFGFFTTTGTSYIPYYSTYAEKYDLALQKRISDTSAINLSYGKLVGQNYGVDETNYKLYYQSLFAKNWRFDLNYNWSSRQNDYNQIQVTFTWTEPEGKAQAAFAHDTVDNVSSVRVNKNTQYSYNDLQLSMFGAKQKTVLGGVESQRADISANYYATKYEARFQLAGNSSGGDSSNLTALGLGTAIAWTQESLSFARPIGDSFAVLEPEGMSKHQKLEIPNGNKKDNIEIKNKDNFVFSNLTSYVESNLRLDSTGLGASSSLERESFRLFPKYRSGMYIPLKVIKSLTLRGKLAGEGVEPSGYLSGKIKTADGKVFTENFFTDESGYFAVDGLSYGKYQIELADSRYKKIIFELVERKESDNEDEVEDPESSVFELGTIKLEKEAGT